jgi:hypothetical protein
MVASSISIAILQYVVAGALPSFSVLQENVVGGGGTLGRSGAIDLWSWWREYRSGMSVAGMFGGDQARV